MYLELSRWFQLRVAMENLAWDRSLFEGRVLTNDAMEFDLRSCAERFVFMHGSNVLALQSGFGVAEF